MPTLTQLDNQHEAILVQEENRMERSLAVFFLALFRNMMNAWEDIGLPGARAVISNSQPELEQILENTYLHSGTRGGMFTHQMLEQPKEDFNEEFLLIALAIWSSIEKVETAAEITRTTINIFDKLVIDAEESKIPAADVMQSVGKEFKKRTKNRLPTIATTEAGKGISQGQNDQAETIQRGVVGDVTKKAWKSKGDSKVRETHARANSRYMKTPIDINQNFIVGSGFGLYPRSSTLPAAEVIRCRCYVIYRLVKAKL